jgi:hypothetical protein
MLDLSSLDQINLRAKQILSQPVSTVAPPKPTPAPAPAKPSMISQMAQAPKNFAQKAFQALQVPGQLVEKGLSSLSGSSNYEEAINKAKERNTADLNSNNPVMKFAANTTGRMFNAVPTGVSALTNRLSMDPLNALPMLKLGKVASKIGDATGITKAVAPLVSKVKGFINPNLNLPRELRIAVEKIPGLSGQKIEEMVTKLKPLVNKMTTDERTAAFHLLEPKEASAQGINLADVVKNLGEEGMKKIKPFLHEARQQSKAQVISGVQNGTVTGEIGKGMLNGGGYIHHTDFAKPDNILQRIFKSGVKMSNSYWKKREGKLGYSLDAPVAVAKREAKQIFDQEKLKVLEMVKKNPEWSVKLGKLKEAPAGFVKVAGDFIKGHKTLQGYAVKKEIFDAIINPTEIKQTGVGKVLQGFNRLWKPIVTGYNPAFHAQNVIGNISQMALGGVRDPRRFAQSILGGFSDAEKTLAKEGGVLNSGQVMESIGQNLGDVSGVGKQNILQKFRETGVGKVLNKLNPKNWGNSIENNARTAMYNDVYNKALSAGKTAKEAAMDAYDTTNKYMFNYLSGLGPREKSVRDILPFYSWTRFNTPLQLKELLKQPTFFTAPGKLSQTLEPQNGGSPDNRGYSFPTPWSSPDGGKVRYSPNLPMNNLFDLTTPRETAVDMVSPAIKDSAVLAGNLAGQDWGQIGYKGTSGKPIIPNHTLPETKIRSIMNYLGQRLRPFKDVQSSAKLPFPASILKYLFGGLQNVNDQQQFLNQMFDQSHVRSAKNNELQGAIKTGDKRYTNSVLRSMNQ